MTKLWLVGQYRGGGAWDFQGIFDSRGSAVCACKTDMYFIAPINLNEELPMETIAFADIDWPLREAVKA